MKLNLIIDTSTERGLVVFAKGLDPLLIKPLPFGYQSSRWVVSAIESGFQELGVGPSSLRLIAAGSGPGLFTGIRVGVAVAKGLAVSLGLPLIGLPTLEGFTSPCQESFISLVDLRLGRVYWMIQERDKEGVKPLTFPKVSSLEEFIKEVEPLGFPIIGPSFQKISLKNTQEHPPDAFHLAALVEKLFQEGKGTLQGELSIRYS